MTFNFGHKLLIAFIAFGSLMFYLVYQSLHTDFELVSKNYYQDELDYQQVIDATKNANALSSKTNVFQKGSTVYLQLPIELANQSITGKVYFYCPADSKKDRTIILSPDKSGLQAIIIGEEIGKGAYQVKVNWTTNEINYYQDTYVQVK